jgi:hypothetical protein
LFFAQHHARQEHNMKSNFGCIAALALITMLGTVALFLSSRSLAAMQPQGGGISVTLGIGQRPGAPYTVTCESKSSRRTYCVADTRGGATLQQQFPGSAPCIFGNTWGADGEGIWVQAGCRATFIVNPYNGGPWWWDPARAIGHPARAFPAAAPASSRKNIIAGNISA